MPTWLSEAAIAADFLGVSGGSEPRPQLTGTKFIYFVVMISQAMVLCVEIMYFRYAHFIQKQHAGFGPEILAGQSCLQQLEILQDSTS